MAAAAQVDVRIVMEDIPALALIIFTKFKMVLASHRQVVLNSTSGIQDIIRDGVTEFPLEAVNPQLA